MGRPRKALATNRKHLTATERASRGRVEAAYKVGRTALEDYEGLAAQGLDEEAWSEYKRIVSLAHWLDDLDRNDLIAYVIAWSRSMKIATSADARREVLALPRGDGSKKLIRNPMWVIWQECCKEMRSISLKLGLSAIDRLKLVDPEAVEPPVNKYLKYLEVRG